MIAPEIPLDVDPLGGVRIIYMIMGEDGWLEQHQMLVTGGLDGWRNARMILDDPNTIRWQAVQDG